MGNLSNQIAAITAEVQNLATLVQAFLNAQGQGIDIDQIKNQINQVVQTAIANIMAQLDGLDVTVLRSDVDQEIMNGLAKALLSAGAAHKEIEILTSKYIQHGEATLRLRGVQSGCAATRSSTATRNLNLSAGVVFGGRQMLTVNTQPNGTTIHNNPGSVPQVCEVYVVDNGTGFLDFRTTPFGEVTPDAGWPLYRVTVPAGNTEANDQYLANVSLTDIRKLEPNYPVILTAEPFVYVPLKYALPTANYAVILEVVNTDIAWGGDIYTKDKAVNGFKIATNGDCAQWQVRWTVLAKKGVD
ncbi:MAG: hypothetical protein LBP98_07035 [Tannerella sp.]|jgi:hypothetical protein|nr:hypothetical protein [Tannerella sp.]